MANSGEQTIRVRVGETLDRHVQERTITQNDLTTLLRTVGFAKWDHTTVSRFIRGARNLSLEHAIILAAALAVPLDNLLAGGGDLRLGDHTIPAAQIRDIIRTGHVQPEHADNSVLDNLTAAPDLTVSQRIARDLGVTADHLDDVAFKSWDMTFDEQLKVRTDRSERAYTGEDPNSLESKIGGAFARLNRASPARRSGWVTRHAQEMARELKPDLSIFSYTPETDK